MNDLEHKVNDCIREGLTEVIKAKLGGDNSPLDAVIQNVVAERKDVIRKLVEESIDGALAGNFKDSLKDALNHKLAKLLVSKMEGEVEKRLVDLRTNPEFRAKVTIAIYALVDQMVKEQKSK